MATRIGKASSILFGKKIDAIIYSPIYPPPGTPLIPTAESTATRTIAGRSENFTGVPNAPITKTIFSTQEKQEPSMCIVAPKGITISETSFDIPLSAADSILLGIVATEEQVPRDTIAGFTMCENMTFTPSLPAPMKAISGKAVKI